MANSLAWLSVFLFFYPWKRQLKNIWVTLFNIKILFKINIIFSKKFLRHIFYFKYWIEYSWNILFLVLKKIRNNFHTILFNLFFFFPLIFASYLILRAINNKSASNLSSKVYIIYIQLYHMHWRKYQYSSGISTTCKKKKRIPSSILRSSIIETSDERLLSKEGRRGKKKAQLRNEFETNEGNRFRIRCEKRMEYHRVSHRCSNASRLRRPDRIRDAFTRLRRRGCTWELGARRAAY